MQTNYIPLNKIEIYQMSMKLGDIIWEIVEKWDYFQKDTIGKQVVRSADSVAANFSEGYGRYHFKEKMRFNYYSRGSLFETVTWIRKARKRNLMTETEFLKIKEIVIPLHKKLNIYIKKLRINSQKSTKK